MKSKIINAIYCGDSSKEEIQSIQTHFFEEGIQWYSNKVNGERIYKKNIKNYIILENDNLLEGDDDTLNSVSDTVNILRFNSPIGFLRYYKIKNLKTKFN